MCRYELSTTGGSSHNYGKCDVCGEHATEVFIQSEHRQYARPDGTLGWTAHKCASTLFGHEQCLISKQLKEAN